MGKETLLEPQIDAGMHLLKELDNRSFDIQSALWFYYPDLDKWKLLLFSPKFDPEKASAQYSDVFDALAKTNTVGSLSFDSIQLVFKNDKLLNLLKNIIRVKGQSKVRMTSNYLNGFYIDDAMIYRNTIH
jgi:hypothetical protein